MKKKLAFILGIRPDIIRAALIIEHLRKNEDFELVFIWSGQHYSQNLKDIFFSELAVKPAEIDLGCVGSTDAEVVASIISRLYVVLSEMKPEAVVFLGDTNTTTGAIAAAQLNIPIVHIEGCMRSYDWRMPEEKYRTCIDHLADVIYAYFDEYKAQGVSEGLNPKNIVVVQNPIVDILNHYYFDKKQKFDDLATETFFTSKGLSKGNYYLMTCHRRENVHEIESLKAIINLVAEAKKKVFFPASYRTQAVLKELGLGLPANMILVDPIGYEEMLVLMVNSSGILTDSGTVVEEASVLNVPCVQMRRATERPQVYDAGGCVKFDPSNAAKYPAGQVIAKLESLAGKSWPHLMGDGKTSERIAEDLAFRLRNGKFRCHKPEDYHLSIQRAYQDDKLNL